MQQCAYEQIVLLLFFSLEPLVDSGGEFVDNNWRYSSVRRCSFFFWSFFLLWVGGEKRARSILVHLCSCCCAGVHTLSVGTPQQFVSVLHAGLLWH